MLKRSVPKNTTLVATANVWETLPDYTRKDQASLDRKCDWVEFNPDLATGITGDERYHVMHTNKLGLANEDLIQHQACAENDKTAECKEFQKTILETLHISDLAAIMPELQRCSVEGADTDIGPEHCNIPLVRSDGAEFTDKFEGDHLCESANMNRARAGTLTLRGLDHSRATLEGTDSSSVSGYHLVLPGDDPESRRACKQLWDVLAQREAAGGGVAAAIANPPYQAWHTMAWGTLTDTEKGYWTAVGADVAHNYSLAATGDWNTFSKAVYVAASQPWSCPTDPAVDDCTALGDDAKNALTKLQFTEETWGRQWALLERIFFKSTGWVGMSWDELMPTERQAMQALGWSDTGMADNRTWDGTGSQVDWDDADAPLPSCLETTDATVRIKASGDLSGCANASSNAATWAKLQSVRITKTHWDRLQQKSTVHTPGCFWHTGKREPTHHTHATPAGRIAEVSRRERRSDTAARSRRSVVCGAGAGMYRYISCFLVGAAAFQNGLPSAVGCP